MGDITVIGKLDKSSPGRPGGNVGRDVKHTRMAGLEQIKGIEQWNDSVKDFEDSVGVGNMLDRMALSKLNQRRHAGSVY